MFIDILDYVPKNQEINHLQPLPQFYIYWDVFKYKTESSFFESISIKKIIISPTPVFGQRRPFLKVEKGTFRPNTCVLQKHNCFTKGVFTRTAVHSNSFVMLVY